MTARFLDTSGWFAALSPKEAKHRAAHAAYRAWIEGGDDLVTTNLVVAEMQILLMRFRGAEEGLRFIDSLYKDPSHEVVFVDRALERTAVEGGVGLRGRAHHWPFGADAGSATIVVAVGGVQPTSQHFPGWRTAAILRAGSAKTLRSSKRSTRSTLSPTG